MPALVLSSTMPASESLAVRCQRLGQGVRKQIGTESYQQGHVPQAYQRGVLLVQVVVRYQRQGQGIRRQIGTVIVWSLAVRCQR